MSDENGATGTQADPETQPPAGTSPAQAASEAGENQPESISLEEAKKLRSEANSLRRRLKELEEADRQRAEADLTETQRLQKRLDELEAERERLATAQQEQAIRMATVTAAARQGFANPELAFRLIDRSAVEMDEAGEPRNIPALLAALLKAEPYLAGAATRPTGSADGGARGTPSTRDQAAAAEQAGDLRTARSIKSQQLLAIANKK